MKQNEVEKYDCPFGEWAQKDCPWGVNGNHEDCRWKALLHTLDQIRHEFKQANRI